MLKFLHLVFTPLIITLTTITVMAMQTTTRDDGTIELIHGKGDPTHAIIWLHGLGATSGDFPPIVPELGLRASPTIRFVFPQAPNRPVTVNGGMVMPAWYDIKGVDIKDKQDAQGMQESQAFLQALVQQQIALGIPSEHIILAGFSQGGAVAYHTFVRSERRLAGMLNLSTYLPFAENVKVEQSGVNLKTPIFASHGTFDPVVPLALGEMSVTRLRELGYAVTWETYPMQHQVVMEQIQEIGRWINSVFEN